MGTASNVIVGVAQLYIAPAATSSPSFAATGLVTTPTTPWVAVGFTESGVVLYVDRKTNNISVEEQSTPVLVTDESTDVTIDVTFAEDVLANALIAYGGGSVTTNDPTSEAPGTTVLTLADALNTVAVAFVGTNAFGLDRLFYCPELMSAGKVKTSYQRAKAARTYPTTFTAICPLGDIVITDATAVAS